MTRSGFTLVEVLVALVVLEVGLLGVVGTLVLAARTMSRAEALERGVVVAELVLDSLRASDGPGAGTRRWDGGEVRWSMGAGGTVQVDVSGVGDSTLIVLSGLLALSANAEP